MVATESRFAEDHSTGSPYNSCGPICLNKACSNLTLCDFLSDERSLLFRHIWQSSPHLPPFPPPLLTRPYSTYYMVVWGGVGKIVKYGGMSNDRSSDKKSHKVGFEQALFKQIGPQLLYGLPVTTVVFSESIRITVSRHWDFPQISEEQESWRTGRRKIVERSSTESRRCCSAALEASGLTWTVKPRVFLISRWRFILLALVSVKFVWRKAVAIAVALLLWIVHRKHRGSQRAAVEWRLHKLVMAVNRAY